MVTLRISDLYDQGGLAFDLRDILRVLAPHSLRATWTLGLSEEGFWAIGEGAEALEELAERSGQIGGAELLAIADALSQVVWGDFTGTLPDNPLEEWVTIRAIDSSYYEISTSDDAVVAKIMSRFDKVELVDTARI